MKSYILFVFRVSFSFVFCDKNSSTTPMIDKLTQFDNKTEDFLDKLKKDLRRNNDDYIEPIEYLSINKTGTSSTVKTDLNINNNEIKEHNRRTFEKILDDSSNKKSTLNHNILKANTIDNITKVNNDTKDSFRVNPILKSDKFLNQVSINSSKLKFANKEKFIKFVQKNKDLWRDFKKSMPTQRQSVRASSPISETTKQVFRMDNEVTTLRVMEDQSNNELPNADELEMYRAKGGSISYKRMKGRLCQRNVLIPEGPKYDSKGNEYMAKYKLARGKVFPHTQRPKSLYPRCCNCCKKSVLGCE